MRASGMWLALGLHWACTFHVYNGQRVYCGLSIALEVILNFTTHLYQYSSAVVTFPMFSDEPEVFLSKYSQTAILHAAHFWRVVKSSFDGSVSFTYDDL